MPVTTEPCEHGYPREGGKTAHCPYCGHPLPELAGVPEIAQRLGISRQRVYQVIETYADFPTPIATLHSGRIWRLAEIDEWAERWEACEPRRRPIIQQEVDS